MVKWAHYRQDNQKCSKGDLIYFGGGVLKCTSPGVTMKILMPDLCVNFETSDEIIDGGVVWQRVYVDQYVDFCKVGQFYNKGDKVRFRFKDPRNDQLVYECISPGVVLYNDLLYPFIDPEIGDAKFWAVGQMAPKEKGETMKNVLLQDKDAIAQAIATGVKQGLASSVSEGLCVIVRKALGDTYPQFFKASSVGQALEAILVPVLVRELSTLAQGAAPDAVTKTKQVCDLAITQSIAQHSKILTALIMPILEEVGKITK